MAGLVPAIHVFSSRGPKTWMPATSAGMTMEHIGEKCLGAAGRIAI
jgi:hypothetical protein